MSVIVCALRQDFRHLQTQTPLRQVSDAESLYWARWGCFKPAETQPHLATMKTYNLTGMAPVERPNLLWFVKMSWCAVYMPSVHGPQSLILLPWNNICSAWNSMSAQITQNTNNSQDHAIPSSIYSTNQHTHKICLRDARATLTFLQVSPCHHKHHWCRWRCLPASCWNFASK